MFDNCLTKGLKLEADKKPLICIKMKEEIITVREFLRNFKELANKKKILVVMKNGRQQGTYIPYKEWKKIKKEEEGVILTKELIESFSFNSGEKDLSKKIDEIVYGVSNPYRNDDDR